MHGEEKGLDPRVGTGFRAELTVWPHALEALGTASLRFPRPAVPVDVAIDDALGWIVACRRRKVAGTRGRDGVEDGVGVLLLEARGYLIA